MFYEDSLDGRSAEVADALGEAGEQRRRERVIGVERDFQLENGVFLAVDPDARVPPVDDPVFADAPSGVKPALSFVATLFVGRTGRQNLDDKLRAA